MGRLRAAAGGVMALVALLALTATAAAAETASSSFAEPGEHPFVVPAGVTLLEVRLVGGRGAEGGEGLSNYHAPGGAGATVTAAIVVTPGETLFAEVAGAGSTTGSGGYGGGGPSGSGTGEAAGGGGGASDIRICSAAQGTCAGETSLASRLVVAGGGGGGGRGGGDSGSSTSIKAGEGGAAGVNGASGAQDGHGDAGGEGGRAGGQSEGGAAGGHSETAATSGSLGLGGAGGANISGRGGGGGGGGLEFAGGGGTEVFSSAGGGGGGGGSGVPAGAVGVSGFNLVPTVPGAEASVVVTWTLPPPAAVTGPAQSLTSSSAVLTGTVNPDGSAVSDCHFSVSPAPASGATYPCAQQVGSGQLPVPVSATVAGLSPTTTYTVTLSATGTQGSASGAPIQFTTSAAMSATSAATFTISALKIAPTRFRKGSAAARISLARGARITFTLSAAASVRLSFQRASAGISVAGSCRAPSAAHPRGHRCTRWVTVPHPLTLAAPTGADTVSFDGVLAGHRTLTPGGYRLTATASAGSQKAAAALHPRFTLLG